MRIGMRIQDPQSRDKNGLVFGKVYLSDYDSYDDSEDIKNEYKAEDETGHYSYRYHKDEDVVDIFQDYQETVGYCDRKNIDVAAAILTLATIVKAFLEKEN